MRDFEYDDRKFQRLCGALTPKQRRQALRGAMRRSATLLRKASVTALRQSGRLRPDANLLKGVRSIVYKKKALGFRVTIGTKYGKKGPTSGYHHNRFGLDKPVLIWNEEGTKARRTRRGARRGRIQRIGFMAKAKERVLPQIESKMKQEIISNIKRIAEKYGCSYGN